MDAWIETVRPHAAAIAGDPGWRHWYRHGGTWFVGVNALPNDACGAVNGGPPLAGEVVSLAAALVSPSPLAWDRGQVSICHPGYPKRDTDQSESSHRFRLERDAAHVDGLYAEAPERRRFLREFHAFILGIPLAAVEPGSSPFVVWEGSQHIMREMFKAELSNVDPDEWQQVDLTDAYHHARRRAFDTCRRVELTTRPGETYLVHRMALHGMAPWTASGGMPRTIIYFRPELPDPRAWLANP